MTKFWKFIKRDYRYTEHEDFLLNVQDRVSYMTEAVPCYDMVGSDDGSHTNKPLLVGWKIQGRYE